MSNRTQRRAEQRRAAKLARKAATPAENIMTENVTTAPEPSHASAAQIAANRENATHSTGPRSEIGKATVSQNRRTHGLLSSVFTVLPCENQAEYDLLLTTLLAEHKPENTTECLLVTSMAQHRWLLDRATRLQETTLDPATGQIANEKLFSLYLRYASTHERAFHKCLNDLLKLRKDERLAQIGFESQKRQAERHASRLRLEEIELRTREMKLLPEKTTTTIEIPEEADPQTAEMAA